MFDYQRRPRWDPERIVRLAVTVINAVAALIDAIHGFH